MGTSTDPRSVLPNATPAGATTNPARSNNPIADMRATGYGASIARAIRIKGEIIGEEDLYIDGEMEGKIELANHRLTLGPNSRVHADIVAREIVVMGTLKGNLRAHEWLDIRKTASITGDVVVCRISIEDGAYLKGKVDIQLKEPAARAKAAAGAATSAGTSAQRSGSTPEGTTSQQPAPNGSAYETAGSLTQ